MGQQRQQIVMGGRLHPIHNAAQLKKFFIWGLGLVVPFLVLFCIFPSGTPPYNHIVVSQLQVPPLRARSDHATLHSNHRKAEEKLITSSIDESNLASKREKRRSDGLSPKKMKKQNDGIKAEMSSMDSVLSTKKMKRQNDGTTGMDSSSKKAKKQMNKEYDAPAINILIDKELDDQTNEEESQTKKSSRNGKIKKTTGKVSDTEIGEFFSFSGKGDAKQDDEASPDLYTAKSRSGRKPDKEKEEISSLGKKISANEEDPKSPRSSSSTQSTRKEMGENFMKSEDSIADAEEDVSFIGKEKTSKQRLRKEGFTKSGKMGYNPRAIKEKIGTNHAADLFTLENEMLIEPSTTKKRAQRFSAENIGEDDDLDDQQQSQDDDDDDRSGEHDSMDYTSHVIAKALPSNTKQSGKCRYYEGRWIIDSKDPLYMDSTCSWMSINDHQDCKVINKSTKPIKWRWQPRDCNVERFKVKSFLKLMQRKSLAFVGDKLAKAQMQSLVCLLAQVEKPSIVYDNKDNKSMSWYFSSSNFTISMVWSPYLVQEVDENGNKKLHLDKLDTKWAVMVPTLDVLILGVGSLFIEPTIYMVRDEVVGCYACKDLNTQNNITELSMYSGFRATMRSTIMGVGALPGFEGIALFLQPFGFEGNGSYHSLSMKMKEIQEEELYQAHKRGSISNQSKMEVLHTNLISVSKHDQMQGPKSPTCLVHSPLVDTWNQFLQHTLTRLLNHNSYT